MVGKDDEEPPSRVVDAAGSPVTGARPPRPAAPTCRRRWPTCRRARPSARWCTPCSSTPTPRRRTCAPSCSGTSTSSCGWWPVELDREELADALLAVCDSPLGGPAPRLGGVTLGDVPLRDRLRELDFEFPLTGGDRPPGRSRRRTSGRPGAAAEPAPARGRPACASYAEPLRGPLGDQSLRGYLTGSIDVVLRVPTADGPRLPYVVDYKTNRLGETGRAADLGRTTGPTALAAAMLHSHYPLQALLYAVVLHRYLRWRLPATTPSGTSAACSTSSCAACAGPDTPRGRRPAVRRLRLAAAGAAGRGALSDLLDGDGGMTETAVETDDARDRATPWRPTARRARRGSTRAGVLEAADVHVHRALGCHRVPLAGEADARSRWRVALAVRAVRHGSAGVDLATRGSDAAARRCPGRRHGSRRLPWPAAGSRSARGWPRPACCGSRATVLYLDRYRR